MSSRWLEANSQRFTADVVRGFCSVSQTLREQFTRFERAGNLSFPVLKNLLGSTMNKGPLWQLKDLSHHLLRDAEGSTPSARLLDWAIGYIFHESIKLMEDAHQHQYYTPRLQGLIEAQVLREEAALVQDFLTITGETHSDMRQGVNRISRLLSHSCSFFRLYVADQGGNRHLARFLHDNETEAREVFQEEFSPLLKTLYGENPERLHMEAALSLLEGGHVERAKAAAQKAAAMAPNAETQELLQRVETESAVMYS